MIDCDYAARSVSPRQFEFALSTAVNKEECNRLNKSTTDLAVLRSHYFISYVVG